MTKTEFQYSETGILNRPYTPSRWLDGVEYIPVTRLRISCGGNMGGAQWFEHVLQTEQTANIPINRIITVTRIDPKYEDCRKDIRINTRFIVDAEDFKLAIVRLDISEWKNMARTSPDAAYMDDILTQCVLLEKNVYLTLK